MHVLVYILRGRMHIFDGRSKMTFSEKLNTILTFLFKYILCFILEDLEDSVNENSKKNLNTSAVTVSCPNLKN